MIKGGKMVNITITIPDELIDNLIEAFCYWYNYQEIIHDVDLGDIPNPETKAQFTKRMVKEYVRDIYRRAKLKQHAEGEGSISDQANDDTSGIDISS